MNMTSKRTFVSKYSCTTESFWNLKPQIRRRVEMCVAEISQEMDIFNKFMDEESIFNRKLLISIPIQKCHHHNLLIFLKIIRLGI